MTHENDSSCENCEEYKFNLQDANDCYDGHFTCPNCDEEIDVKIRH